MGWIVLGIVIVVAVISAVSQVLKGQQDAAAPKRRPARSSGGVKSSSGDIDRFLQEIDRLRKKQPAPPPVVPSAAKSKQKNKARPAATPVRQAVPTVEPVRSRRVEPPVASRVEDLPVASVVAPRTIPPIPELPAPRSRGAAPTPAARSGPQTPFGKNLAAMLASPQAVPMGVVLQEILGPPKCKQG